MKKSLIIGLLGMVCSAGSSFGQGIIRLDNYNTSGPYVTYGSPGIPANGVSGTSGIVGGGLKQGWTLGLYYVVGDVTSSIIFVPSGSADPSTLGGGLVLGAGNGSTAAFASLGVGSFPGAAISGSAFSVPGTSESGGDTITIMMVAYSGSGYANAVWRGHSSAFIMPTSAANSSAPNPVGRYMLGFAVVPEPSVWVLACMSGFILLRSWPRK
jgi:hypothetical protein